MMSALVDLFDESTQECPYSAYKTLRDDDPVHYEKSRQIYVLTRYQDIVQVLGRPDVFLHGPSEEGRLADEGDSGEMTEHQDSRGLPMTVYKDDGGVVHRAPLNSDPPVHRQYRNMIDQYLGARGASNYVELVHREVNSSIESWIADGQVELVTQFAEPFPLAVVTEIFGFDRKDMQRLHEWSSAWVLPFTGNISAEQQQYVTKMLAEFRQYIADVIDSKRARPDDSMISRLLQSQFQEVDGPQRPLTEMELISIIDNLFTGGNHTTTNAIASMMWLIVSTPGLQERLRSDPSIAPGVIEEALRLEPVVQGMFRHSTQEFTIGDVVIPKGATVHLRFAAANRDDRLFEDPDSLDPSRAKLRRHVAFGLGEHHCPGATLARIEMSVSLEALMGRTANFWLLPSPIQGKHFPGFTLRGLRELRLGFEPKKPA
jgi:cytochrome P450